jgi:hypothetical protein
MHEEAIKKTVTLTAHEIALVLQGLDSIGVGASDQGDEIGANLVRRMRELNGAIEAEISPFARIDQSTEGAHEGAERERAQAATEQWF